MFERVRLFFNSRFLKKTSAIFGMTFLTICMQLLISKEWQKNELNISI